MSATPQQKSFHLQHSIQAIMTPQLMLNAISPLKEFATNLMCTKKHNSYSSEEKNTFLMLLINKRWWSRFKYYFKYVPSRQTTSSQVCRRYVVCVINRKYIQNLKLVDSNRKAVACILNDKTFNVICTMTWRSRANVVINVSSLF